MQSIGTWQQKWLHLLVFCSTTVFINTSARAQITPDNTLGAESSRLTPNVTIRGASADRIDGGAQRGSNLFHSFTQFNIKDGQRVYFVNPAGVQNILTRVTGKEFSNILGTLGVEGSANLFLLNPNGIVFGPNARLDVSGSFVGTTANGVQFGNQGIFSATNPDAPPLLTVNPSALLFNQINSGAIINRSRPNATDAANSASFSPQQGSRFLVGGNITFDGGVVTATGNRLELGGLAGEGAVGLSGNGNQMQLNFPEYVPKADVVLQNNAYAQTTGGGAITVHARNLNLFGNSIISTILGAGEGTPGSRALDVVINATGTVALDGKSLISNVGFENSLGDTGNVEINAQSIRLTNSSQIRTYGERNRGNISLNATEDVTLDGNNSYLATFGNRNSIGNSGDITLTARTINLSNQAAINSGNFWLGKGGRTTLQAQDTISLSGGSNIQTSSAASIFGGVNPEPSGDIEIRARSLTLDDPYTSISSRSFQGGRSGDIRITTEQAIALNNFSSISSSTNGQADAGNIQLQTQRLSLTNGARIDTLTSGQGNSGNLSVNASESVIIRGSTIVNSPTDGSFPAFSNLSTQSFGSGNAGQITIDTRRLSLHGGGNILAGSGVGNSGRGGNITVNASDAIEVFGVSPNGVFSALSSTTTGSGNGGNINLTTRRLNIREGGSVLTGASGSGQGGNLTVNASESVEVVGTTPDGNALTILSTGTLGSGNAGNLTINTSRLSIRDGAFVDTSARVNSRGRGGDLTVNASDTVEVVGQSSDGRISSLLSARTAGAGDAGNLTINTRRLSIRDLGVVSTGASEESKGQGGDLTVNASDLAEVVGQSPDGKYGSTLTTATSASGNAGRLNITTSRLSIRDGGVITTEATEGSTGSGGNLTVNARDLVEIGSNSPDTQLSSYLSTSTAGSGNAGRLTIDTRRLSILNGGGVLTSTSASGRGGDLNINARDSVEIVANPARTESFEGLFATTVGSGNAGDLTLSTQRLSLRNGGAVSASSSSTGRGGNLTINARDSVEVAGISNDGSFPSRLNVRSLGEGTAGNLIVNSPRITVKDRGEITAAANTVDGGNITLNTNLLLLQRGGAVTATAGIAQGAGNGGNITINSPSGFIVAVPNENSDITANAFNGQGGRITINATGIYGMVQRSRLDLERFNLNPANLPTNDITAFSVQNPTFSGTIQINTPDIDPVRGLVELPIGVVNTPELVASSCSAFDDTRGNSFTVTGRGGLPPSPDQPLSNDVVWSDTRLPALQQHSSKKPTAKPPDKPYSAIVPATGWVFNGKGQVTLISSVSNATSLGSTPATCPRR